MHHHLVDLNRLPDLLADWGYIGIFAFIFIGNLGVPVPEETVLLAAGFLAARGLLSLEGVFAVALLSAVSGDCCGFVIGRTGGQRVIERLAARFTFVRQRYEQVRVFFEQHGSRAVFMARFIAGARFMAGPMAGAAGMPFWRFLGWNVMGAMAWCPTMVTIGYLVGNELSRAARLVHIGARWLSAVLMLLIIGGYVIWRHGRTVERRGAERGRA